MLRIRLGNLGFSEVSFGSFLVVNFKAQFWFVLTRFWLKNYGPILPHFTVLIFIVGMMMHGPHLGLRI